jgi:hypothetical protein
VLPPPLLPPHAEITSETKSTTNVREVTGGSSLIILNPAIQPDYALEKFTVRPIGLLAVTRTVSHFLRQAVNV